MSSSKRLAPTSKTLRQLYVLSGNQCAKPGCRTVLVNANGTFVGNVCHIRAAKKGGPRYDGTINPEERRAASNLILLCSTCHALVDSEPNEYTVGKLAKWKDSREKAFAEVGKTLRKSYVTQISDEAETIDPSLPGSFGAYIAYSEQKGLWHTFEDDQAIQEATTDVLRYVERLRHITLVDRGLLSAIIEKTIALDQIHPLSSSLNIHPDDLKTIRIGPRPLSQYRIRILGDTLERHDLGYLDIGGEPVFGVRQISKHLSWHEVAQFLNDRGKTVDVLVCELQFSILDQLA